MKKESLTDYLKRGGTIKKLDYHNAEQIITADATEKAQPSFFEQPVDEVISEALGLPQDNVADTCNVHAFFRRQASKRTSANRR
jgi:hypothetical protein